MIVSRVAEIKAQIGVVVKAGCSWGFFQERARKSGYLFQTEGQGSRIGGGCLFPAWSGSFMSNTFAAQWLTGWLIVIKVRQPAPYRGSIWSGEPTP